MQMLSQLSYRPVPRIIPDHGKPRERTIPGVTTDPIIDLASDVGSGRPRVPAIVVAVDRHRTARSRAGDGLRAWPVSTEEACRAMGVQQDRLAVVAGVLA
jgi:hypothetical protein